jgi:hypothetical protein
MFFAHHRCLPGYETIHTLDYLDNKGQGLADEADRAWNGRSEQTTCRGRRANQPDSPV